jgi:hypothetical protein
MAGTLVISTLSDGTNSTSATNAIQGSAKAWANFNASAATIRASYNVSSVVRNAVGDYTVNFSNAQVDTNYAVSCTSTNTSSGNGILGPGLYATGVGTGGTSGMTTSSVRLVTKTSSSSFDVDVMSVIIFR